VSSEFPADIDRRGYLAALVGTGAASLAGCSLLEGDEDSPTASVDEGRARELAERFAPTLYFDAEEKWFPTDPRRYESERDGSPVVSGFDAFDGYSKRYNDPSSPPDPTVFYHVVEYDGSPLSVVQFWQYSAFDQFTTNFHWHDWEVLHVFVDTETDEPQLYVASSHSRTVPNNEFLDPDPDRSPALLVELGSHSNALSINEQRDRFQRLPINELVADITNGSIDGVEAIAELPIAYGLPRDEEGRLPFALPELDGEPIHEDDRLPSVGRTDLLDESLVVRSFDALASPPSELPERATGLRFDHTDRNSSEADVGYDLVPAGELEHLTGFTGPQLSFEFSIPGFAEDAVSGHLSTTGVPWESSRYDNPAADISDPNHRAELARRYDAIGEPAPVSTIVASVTEATANDDAPDDEGVTTEPHNVESVALLESDPEAVPTFGGVAVLRGVQDGDHRLTVNGAGVAPHSEAVSVQAGEDVTTAGVDGEIPLVSNEQAVKVEVDPRGADSELSDLAIEDDFAGRLYDAPLSEPDAVYVHRGGAYTAEVRDTDNEVGAIRVTPGDEGTIRLGEPRTGKASLATFLADIAEETAASIGSGATADDSDATGGNDDDDRDRGDDRRESDDDTGSLDGSENAVRGLRRALAAVAEAARRAAERAEAGDRGGADTALESVSTRLERVGERLAEARGSLPAARERAIERRLERGRRRSDQATEAEKL
jgi:hypothetical protein